MTITICIQCALKALLDHSADDPINPPTFEETPEEHVKRVHPDPAKTALERRILEERFRVRLKGRDPATKKDIGEILHRLAEILDNEETQTKPH